MSAKFRGSKTEQNLMNAYAGEAMARNRYTYYSAVAKKEGYEQIAAIFYDTAENELEHAKLFFNHICNNPLGHVDSFYPFEIGTTEDNLNSAISGEIEEYDVYQITFEYSNIKTADAEVRNNQLTTINKDYTDKVSYEIVSKENRDIEKIFEKYSGKISVEYKNKQFLEKI